jgi:ribosomal-protein-alanine N-acetyltransferase
MSEPYQLPESFHTDRFEVRRIRASDAEAVFTAYAADPVVTKFLSWRPHKNVDETRMFLDLAEQEWDRGSGFPSVLLRRGESSELIGMAHPHVFSSRISYGYVIRADSWGQGCASEVLRWMLDHALSHPAIYRTQAFCDIENRASARVMEKAGMTQEGLLQRYSQSPNISDAPRDCLMYSRVR